MTKKCTPSEVLEIIGEILQWNLPMMMTAEKLDKIKLIAGSALTQTHDYLQNSAPKIIISKTDKQEASISDIARFNRNKRRVFKKR